MARNRGSESYPARQAGSQLLWYNDCSVAYDAERWSIENWNSEQRNSLRLPTLFRAACCRRQSPGKDIGLQTMQKIRPSSEDNTPPDYCSPDHSTVSGSTTESPPTSPHPPRTNRRTTGPVQHRPFCRPVVAYWEAPTTATLSPSQWHRRIQPVDTRAPDNGDTRKPLRPAHRGRTAKHPPHRLHRRQQFNRLHHHQLQVRHRHHRLRSHPRQRQPTSA